MSDYHHPDPPRKEIYTYTAPWSVYAMAWSRRYVIKTKKKQIILITQRDFSFFLTIRGEHNRWE